MTWIPAILIALTFHEYAHGKVADLLGDHTPYHQGRLTLNPLPHIDWVGFLMLLLFKFGWAKPVQVNPMNFKNVGMKRGMLLVSAAGPAMNFALAFVGMLLYKYVLLFSGQEWAHITMNLLIPLIWINIFLAIFNLLPVPPLDGSKILAGLLPDAGTKLLYSLEQYGPLLLLLLIMTGVVGKIILPLAYSVFGLLEFILLG